jgi:superfamily II RNA helicase
VRIPLYRSGADTSLKSVFRNIGVPEREPFRPDPFQREALQIVATADCLVAAPTGAGKTWIAVEAIRRLQKAGPEPGRAWYASPLKALTNSKYIEFGRIFGPDRVGILTGDRKENADAPIIVGTTEILRNQLYDAMHQGLVLGTDFVVLDEAHFLGDEDRGVVWEEVMIYLPTRIPLLLLSATIGNAEQIAAWLTTIRGRRCRVVRAHQRPVPLFPLMLHPTGTLLPLVNPGRPGKVSPLHKKVRRYLDSRRPQLLTPPHKLPPFGQILATLRRYNLLPAIFFLKSRADCDSALELCRENWIADPERQQLLEKQIETLLKPVPHLQRHRQLKHLKRLAVGAHHSGQLPAWKLTLETLMTHGLLDAIFATSTVAAGVNFPARTVVFLNSDRFNGREFLPLSPTEFHQMTGRAGRRGMDHIGFALMVPGKFMNLRHMGRLLFAPASDVRSQIRINFAMVLNLLLSHTPAQIEELLERSLATYQLLQSRSRSRRAYSSTVATDDSKALWRDFLRHLAFLKDTGYVDHRDRLTAEGLWASQLRVDQPLLIAEGFRHGAFPQDDPALLAAMTAVFVYEQDEDTPLTGSRVPERLLTAFRRLTRCLQPFVAEMRRSRFAVRPLFLRPAAILCDWCEGISWETVCASAAAEEGDLAMLILRTADNLRHIRALKRVFPEAAAAADTAVQRLLRDPVITEYER